MKLRLALALALTIALSGFLLGAKGDTAPKSKLNGLTEVRAGDWAALCMERSMGLSLRSSYETLGDVDLHVWYDKDKVQFHFQAWGDATNDQGALPALAYLVQQLGFRGLGCLPESEMDHVMKTTELIYVERKTRKALIVGGPAFIRGLADKKK